MAALRAVRGPGYFQEAQTRVQGVTRASFVQIVEVAADVTNHTDITAATNITYEYDVTAFNSAGESTPSVPAEVTVAPAEAAPTPTPTPTPTANSVGGSGGGTGWPLLLALGLLNWFRQSKSIVSIIDGVSP